MAAHLVDGIESIELVHHCVRVIYLRSLFIVLEWSHDLSRCVLSLATSNFEDYNTVSSLPKLKYLHLKPTILFQVLMIFSVYQ